MRASASSCGVVGRSGAAGAAWDGMDLFGAWNLFVALWNGIYSVASYGGGCRHVVGRNGIPSYGGSGGLTTSGFTLRGGAE